MLFKSLSTDWFRNSLPSLFFKFIFFWHKLMFQFSIYIDHNLVTYCWNVINDKHGLLLHMTRIYNAKFLAIQNQTIPLCTFCYSTQIYKFLCKFLSFPFFVLWWKLCTHLIILKWVNCKIVSYYFSAIK